MRIGVDVRTLMDERYSGVSLHNFNLLKKITELDTVNDYRFYYNSFSRDHLPSEKFNKKNIRFVRGRFPNKILNYVFFKFLNRPKIDEKLEADVFLMPHINFIALSALGGKKRGKAGMGKKSSKKILVIHDLSFLRDKSFFSLRKNLWHWMINSKKLINKFDHIVAVSENTKNDIIELCQTAPEKIEVIHPGLGDKFRPLEKNDGRLKNVKEKYDLPDRFIFFLGTLEPRKNAGGLIRAFDLLKQSGELKGIKLVIAGGQGWKTGSIYHEFTRAKFKADIRFLGYIEEEKKVYLYNLAELFVFPSFYEGIGFPPLEAMASGVPVVASFTSSMPEILGDAALLVDPWNLTDIQNAIKQALLDQKLRQRMIAKGLQRAKEFSWEKSARKYLDLMVG